MNECYVVKKIEEPIDWTVTVPGSKSMTNRALLMAALSADQVHLEGVLFSDDSRYFLGALQDLGFDVTVNEQDKSVVLQGCNGKIPKKEATINVGSAGTAARFLTAMLGCSDGTYYIDASEQMKKRPMKPLFELLERMGAGISYEGEEGFLPIRIEGIFANGKRKSEEKLQVELDISKSTQFLSAMLLIAPMMEHGMQIQITSEKTDGSYIRITRNMMKEFGAEVFFDGKNYETCPKTCYHKKEYIIEPDMSAACYFYAAAAITGGKAIVRNVHSDNTQGDLKFLDVLKEMGCSMKDTKEGICVTGPEAGKLSGITINMNDFSDQTMTLAAIAPYADAKVHIDGIGHIRLQESDRIHGIITELRRVGIHCEEGEDNITIYPGTPQPGEIETYEDHRMAMAFSLMGLKMDGIRIKDPSCCKKTFETYFQVLDELTNSTQN